MPTIQSALNRLAAIDARPVNKYGTLAPADIFTPRGPRLGVSGSVGMVPAPPPPQVPRPKTKAPAKPKKKAPAAATASDDEDDDEEDDEEDDASDESKEKSHGLSDYGEDAAGCSVDSSDDEAQLQRLRSASNKVPRPLVLPLRKRPAPHVAPAPEITDYETETRRILRKTKTDPLPHALCTWEGASTREQLCSSMVHEMRQRALASTGTPAQLGHVRQYMNHMARSGTGGDVYERNLKAHYRLTCFGDEDYMGDVVMGDYDITD